MVSHYQQPPTDFLYKQIKAVVEDTGVRTLHFSDESAEPMILEELSRKIIANKLKINWLTHLRFDSLLTIERLTTYRQAGCVTVIMGLEAYNNRILKLMKKGTTISLIDKILSNVSWSGTNIFVYMIVGFPTETEEEALYSYSKIKQFKEEGTISSYVYNVFRITSGSPICENTQLYGITHIHPHASRDIDPNIFDFDAPGMSRDTAKRLEDMFNCGMKTGDFNG